MNFKERIEEGLKGRYEGLSNGFKRVNQIWYQDSPYFEFDILDKGFYKIRFFCRKKQKIGIFELTPNSSFT